MKTPLSKILLKIDPRLFNYQEHYGSTADFPVRLFTDAGFLEVQPVGDVECTAFSACNAASAMTGKRYDHIALWADMQGLGKVSASGADPADAFSIAVKKGLHVSPSGDIEKPASAYFQVELGEYDFFTNVKSYITLEYRKGYKRTASCGTQWFGEWLGLNSDSVLPAGKTAVSEHEWMVTGWDDELHPNCFRIDWWGGRYFWLRQEDFNAAMDALYGTKALGLAATTEEEIEYLKSVKVSLLKKALGICYNLYIQLSARLSRRSI